MVRFIIIVLANIQPQAVYVYIPIWLDLLLMKIRVPKKCSPGLHSNMVRFIIRVKDARAVAYTTFTFQYG